jgi:hypothetical protein
MLFIFDETFRYVELVLRNVVELMSERNLIHIDVRLLHARVPLIHGLINYKDTKPKYCHLKIFKRDFAAGVFLSEAPSPPLTPYPPTYMCILYTGKGGRDEPERRLEGLQYSSQS